MKKITPVILCGGSGTRLWPLSRKSYPKQFVPLVGEKTLFQNSAARLSGPLFNSPVVVTNSDFRFIVTQQLQEVGIDPGAILIEPEGRNTAPAISVAALFILRQDPDAILLVAPSDHVITDIEAFHTAVVKGLTAVDQGHLVTFGITPTRAETGYGYLELEPSSKLEFKTLKKFVEKPGNALANEMLDAGSFLWNSGIYLFSAKDIIAAFDKYNPSLIDLVRRSLDESALDLGFCRLESRAWLQLEDISIDYSIMEKIQKLAVVPFEGGWSDLGDWAAVWRDSCRDVNGVHTSARATSIDCQQTLLRSESDSLEIVGIGLSNIIAIAMKDAVLVSDMSRSQDITKAVAKLKSEKATQAIAFPKDHRPWGWFEILIIDQSFQVKRIHVHPGASLSLQSHQHRSEHWIVVSGIAEVTIGDAVKTINENQSAYIPAGCKHRMKNSGKLPMVLIEVQTGTYLGEDDIIRYEDIYARH